MREWPRPKWKPTPTKAVKPASLRSPSEKSEKGFVWAFHFNISLFSHILGAAVVVGFVVDLFGIVLYLVHCNVLFCPAATKSNLHNMTSINTLCLGYVWKEYKHKSRYTPKWNLVSQSGRGFCIAATPIQWHVQIQMQIQIESGRAHIAQGGALVSIAAARASQPWTALLPPTYKTALLPPTYKAFRQIGSSTNRDLYVYGLETLNQMRDQLD